MQASMQEESKYAQMVRDEDYKEARTQGNFSAAQDSPPEEEERRGGKRGGNKGGKNKNKRDKEGGQPQPKSKKAQRWEKKMEEHKMQQELEATITHRFVNLTQLLSQRAIGKDMIVEHVWFTATNMVVRCQHNFKALENPMLKNKYVKGKNKFQGADKVIYKLAYYQKRPENKDRLFTVLYEDRFLGLIESPVTVFLDTSETPLHRIQLFKLDGEIIWDRKNKFTTI